MWIWKVGDNVWMWQILSQTRPCDCSKGKDNNVQVRRQYAHILVSDTIWLSFILVWFFRLFHLPICPLQLFLWVLKFQMSYTPKVTSLVSHWTSSSIFSPPLLPLIVSYTFFCRFLFSWIHLFWASSFMCSCNWNTQDLQVCFPYNLKNCFRLNKVTKIS